MNNLTSPNVARLDELDRRILIELSRNGRLSNTDLARRVGFQCIIANTAEEALALAKQFKPSAVVLDIGLPDNSGMFVLERLMREIRRRTRVVGAFPDGQSALMLVAARLRHVAATKWGTKRYLQMNRLAEIVAIA